MTVTARNNGLGSPLKLFYCDHYDFPLPDRHKFPLPKYRLLREQLEGDARFDLQPSKMVAREDVLLIHDADYVDGFLNGTLPAAVSRRIGLPWSPEFVHRTLASAGGTLLATQEALRTGFGGTLAGGTHHAFRGEGSGFCVFNDIAIATEWVRRHEQIERIAIIDLDVHQGDGTAAIFGDDPGVFTLSIHGERNFPFRKQKSTLDVELPDGTGDDAYLAALAAALHQMWTFEPHLLFFQAGVDALETDRLGRLSLTMAGLEKRDQMVFRSVFSRGLAAVVTLGGGYSDPIQRTVAAHAQTFSTAARILAEMQSSLDLASEHS